MRFTRARMKTVAVMPYSMHGIMKNGVRHADGQRHRKKGLCIHSTDNDFTYESGIEPKLMGYALP
jgi:hypothetical protein